jgi:hypothetical protein
MSSEQDYNFRIKFESGAFKRKRKAELKQKNPEVRKLLINIFKRNDDAIAGNKDLGKNESGEPVEGLHESFKSVLQQCFANGVPTKGFRRAMNLYKKLPLQLPTNILYFATVIVNTQVHIHTHMCINTHTLLERLYMKTHTYGHI